MGSILFLTVSLFLSPLVSNDNILSRDKKYSVQIISFITSTLLQAVSKIPHTPLRLPMCTARKGIVESIQLESPQTSRHWERRCNQRVKIRHRNLLQSSACCHPKPGAERKSQPIRTTPRHSMDPLSNRDLLRQACWCFRCFSFMGNTSKKKWVAI